MPPTHEVRNSQGVQVGDHNIQYNTVAQVPLPAMESVSALPGLSRIPPETAIFVGRSGELKQLDEMLSGAGRAAVVAVHGLGGVGKSTLAARFANLHAGRFELRWWITADSPTAIDTGLAELAETLLPATVELPVEQRSALGVRWLATHDGWLLVLDNLTLPDHVLPLLERVRTGTVLMTSRNTTSWGPVNSVRLDVLPAAEAADLLASTVRDGWSDATHADLVAAGRLCEELGYLPLAVEQAGAYLAQTRISPTAYLDLLSRYPARLYTAIREGGDAQRTMARVWQVTLDHLASTPLAGQLLRQLAWYAPDNIPRAWLATTAEEPDLLHALGRLAAYSMITLDRDTISVHRLVQAVARTPDSGPDNPHNQPDDVTAARDAATDSLHSALVNKHWRNPADWPTFQTVLLHVSAALRFAKPDQGTLTLAYLLTAIGSYLIDQGDAAAAVEYISRARQAQIDILGPGHLDTISTRNNLARAYETAGSIDRAIPLFEAALADGERVCGSDHPVVLTMQNNLAHSYQSIGNLNRAIALFEAVLANGERVLGVDHPDSLTFRNNLAYACEAVGDLHRAITLNEASLAGRRRILGPEHPDTLASGNNLAGAYRASGDLARAIPLYELTLADSERILGTDHPDSLNTRENLAAAYHAAGDVARAILLHEATLVDRQRVLGPDHPSTLITSGSLACAYESAGEITRAIALFEATVANLERVLGSAHPDTLTARHNMAGAYETAGDLARAISLYESTLADRKRVLGFAHPHTLASCNNLAYSYYSIGDRVRAIPLWEAVLADAERVLGSGHPHTERIRLNLLQAKSKSYGN